MAFIGPRKSNLRKRVNALNSSRQTVEIPVKKPVVQVLFAPYEWCSSILAVATDDTLQIYELVFVDRDNCSKCMLLDEFHLGENFICNLMSFSPKTDITVNPKSIRIACGDNTKDSFRYYLTNERKSVPYKPHKSLINDIAVEPIEGCVVASVGDDLTCVLSTLPDAGTQRRTMTFPLQSPGFKVEWHRSEERKLIVAEKQGIITVFDTLSQNAERSFECQTTPFMFINWCSSDSNKIAGVALKKWYVWNFGSSQPIDEGDLPYDAMIIKFNNSDREIFATRNLTGDQLSIHLENLRGSVDLEGIPVGNGLSFHAIRSVLAFGGINKVYILRIFGGEIRDACMQNVNQTN